jgi:hypothetical protein
MSIDSEAQVAGRGHGLTEIRNRDAHTLNGVAPHSLRQEEICTTRAATIATILPAVAIEIDGNPEERRWHEL